MDWQKVDCGVMPVNDRVLVLFDSAETKLKSGLFLVPAENAPLKCTGRVLAAGDHESVKVKRGDRVLVDRGMVVRFDVPYEGSSKDGLKYTAYHKLGLVPALDVLAVLTSDIDLDLHQ